MRVSCKGCEAIIAQASGITACTSLLLLPPEDAEFFVFQLGSFKGLQLITYRELLKKGRRIISGQDMEITVYAAESENQQNKEQVLSRQNLIQRDAVRSFTKLIDRAEIFGHYYKTMTELLCMRQQLEQQNLKLRTNEKIIEDLKKELYRKQSLQINLSSEFQSFRDDSAVIESQLEQQYIAGQMKWAKIDMENATLQMQIDQLRTQILFYKQQLEFASLQAEANANSLLQSRQVLGDMINFVIEKGDQSILIHAGL